MAETIESETVWRVVNKVIDDIIKRVKYVEKGVERDHGREEPFWNGYAAALYYIQDVIRAWGNDGEAVVNAALAEADGGFKPDVEIKRMQDLMCDLARLLIDNPTEHLIATDVADGIKTARDLITVLDNIRIDSRTGDNQAQNEDERTTDGNERD